VDKEKVSRPPGLQFDEWAGSFCSLRLTVRWQDFHRRHQR